MATKKADEFELPEVDQKKLVQVYRRLCPDDQVEWDDPRRPIIAHEMYYVGSAENADEAFKVIEWWNQPVEEGKAFVASVRRAVARMRFAFSAKAA